MVPKLKRTFFDILILIERFQRVFFGESSERVNEMSTEIRIDVLWVEFGRSRPINRPIRVVTNDPQIFCVCNQNQFVIIALSRKIKDNFDILQ